jgi:hypothetical protein
MYRVVCMFVCTLVIHPILIYTNIHIYIYTHSNKPQKTTTTPRSLGLLYWVSEEACNKHPITPSPSQTWILPSRQRFRIFNMLSTSRLATITSRRVLAQSPHSDVAIREKHSSTQIKRLFKRNPARFRVAKREGWILYARHGAKYPPEWMVGSCWTGCNLTYLSISSTANEE